MSHHRNPRSLLTPAMHQLLDRMARTRQPPMHALTPAQARQLYEMSSGLLDIASHKLARVEDLQLPTRDGQQLLARLYAPSGLRLPVLLYFHGGGFTIGSVDTHDALCRQLSHLGLCAVLALNYRLAPEHKFPTAVNDAWDALRWLAKEAASLGLDGQRLAVGGDSAGGTLAAVCALLARDAGLPLALQLLFYPGCAAQLQTPSHKTFGSGFVLDEAQINFFFGHYLNTPADRDDWRFAPLLAPDVEGVAPVWMGLAECDPLVDDGLLYADKLRAAGVALELALYRGVVHEHIRTGRLIPVARQVHADAGRALRHAFGVQSS